MTKAKTKIRRVWLAFDPRGIPHDETVRTLRRRVVHYVTGNEFSPYPWDEMRDEGWRIGTATLTWTPPSKAKRSAKR